MVKVVNDNVSQEFMEYCKQNDIIPIKQDQVIAVKAPKNHRLNMAHIAEDISFMDLSDFPYHNEFYKNGQKHLLKALRQGKFYTSAIIDLHNYKQNEAIIKLELVISNTVSFSNTCIKIIHGKGLNSLHKRSVLKGLVRRFLEHHPRVIAYTPALENNGGDGVTLVKLRTGSCI